MSAVMDLGENHTPSPPSSFSSSQAASRSTTPSSTSDVSLPLARRKQIFLPSGAFLDVQFLRDVVTEDVVAWVFVAYSGGPQYMEAEISCVQLQMNDARRATGIVDEVGWRQVDGNIQGKRVPYFVADADIKAGLSIVNSVTLSHTAVLNIFSLASLRSVINFQTSFGRLYLTEKPRITFPPLTQSYLFSPFPSTSKNNTVAVTNPFTTPTPAEWSNIWRAWDLVTLEMIPVWMLHQKPIHLRHKCLFYIGHIPTFMDMLLSKATGEPGTEPKNFWNIFERGIDPHVDDPDHCHNHSEVPELDDEWPSLSSILAFRDGVRARLRMIYEEVSNGKRKLGKTLARTLVMCLEHEGWHVETLLYMLIQRAGTGTLPPPGFTAPPFELLSSQWNNPSVSPLPTSTSVLIGPATITMGHDDSETDDRDSDVEPEHEFGWDNESPARSVFVGQVRAEWRPVTNGEFLAFWKDCKNGVEIPCSWIREESGDIMVRTLYGPVSMEVARHWPVLASYDSLLMYARSKGGRLPSEPELRLFFDLYEVGYEGGANVGFRNWHPVPATTGCELNGGRGGNGGVWEWTTTVFDGHEGFVPTKLFTGYSADFFDGKHQVVLGASYATIPRLAGRRTVRNFWQHNYPYPWVGARVVYDVV